MGPAMNDKSDILVSIIMPVYNAEKYLFAAVQSIIQQTYQNFELIIINDGSTDQSDIIIKELLYDARIVYISRDNKGLVYTLNEGLGIAKSDYIARMDADDICHPERIQRQLSFLINNSDIAVVGCASFIIDENSEVIGRRKTISSYFLNNALQLFGPTLTHPSVMFNRNLLGNDLYYSNSYIHAEDFELWLRLTNNYKVENISDQLFYYRINTHGVSHSHDRIQKLNAAIAYCDLKHPNDKNEKLLQAVRIIQSRNSSTKMKVLSSLIYVLFKHEMDRNIIFKLGYVMRWLIN